MREFVPIGRVLRQTGEVLKTPKYVWVKTDNLRYSLILFNTKYKTMFEIECSIAKSFRGCSRFNFKKGVVFYLYSDNKLLNNWFAPGYGFEESVSKFETFYEFELMSRDKLILDKETLSKWNEEPPTPKRFSYLWYLSKNKFNYVYSRVDAAIKILKLLAKKFVIYRNPYYQRRRDFLDSNKDSFNCKFINIKA